MNNISRLRLVVVGSAAASIVFFAAPVLKLRAEGFLQDQERTNGADITRAVADVRAKSATATVKIGPEQSSPSLTGTVLSAEGYILTKAAETQAMNTIRVWLGDGTSEEARVVKRDDALDLALLKIGRTGLTAVNWGESAALKPAQWLCSLAGRENVMRLGVVSANRRAVPGSGAVMGIRFAQGEKGDDGAQIEEVASEGPAEKAGLRENDVLVELNGQHIPDSGAVKRVISKLQPGDLVKVKYKREGKDAECEVKLASRKSVMMNWSGGDFGNHGTSARTDNYPEILQHDMPLDPADMGGAVFDVQGRAVGLNIARVDRVTNYALPVEVFLSKVLAWIKEDTGKKTAPAGTVK